MVSKAKTEGCSYDQNLDIETKHKEERLIFYLSRKLTAQLQTIIVSDNQIAVYQKAERGISRNC